MSTPVDHRTPLDRDRPIADPQRTATHAAAAVRVLEKRIARLEAAVFPHEQPINRTRPPRAPEVHVNGERNGNRTD